jgi:DNA helicase-2/ATP-dependent DNA helicase PcrA
VVPTVSRKLYDHSVARLGDVLEHIAARYTTRERFLTELTLDPPEATGAEAGTPLLDEHYQILSTIHSAKGQNGTRSSFLMSQTVASCNLGADIFLADGSDH